MIRCNACGARHDTAGEVRACYEQHGLIRLSPQARRADPQGASDNREEPRPDLAADQPSNAKPVPPYVPAPPPEDDHELYWDRTSMAWLSRPKTRTPIKPETPDTPQQATAGPTSRTGSRKRQPSGARRRSCKKPSRGSTSNAAASARRADPAEQKTVTRSCRYCGKPTPMYEVWQAGRWVPTGICKWCDKPN